jgi:hypothetical protein
MFWRALPDPFASWGRTLLTELVAKQSHDLSVEQIEQRLQVKEIKLSRITISSVRKEFRECLMFIEDEGWLERRLILNRRPEKLIKPFPVFWREDD